MKWISAPKVEDTQVTQEITLWRGRSISVVALACLFLLGGCGGNKADKQSQQIQQQISSLQLRVQKLETEVRQLQTQSSTLDVTPPENKITPQNSASPVPVNFQDIQGLFGEKEITQLASLGVFKTTAGKFNPKQAITRAEFVRWLVQANNALYADDPKKMIRLAEGGKPTFPDVPPTHPDYRYIQGMANTGFVIGYDEKTFQPERPLTREEMVAIKTGLDQVGFIAKDADYGLVDSVWKWSDTQEISPRYLPAIYAESFNKADNIKRIYGASKTFKPKEPVTRVEAAICIWKIGDSYEAKTAESTLRQGEKQDAI